MATDPITEVVATENQTVATVLSPSVTQTVAQVPSFAATQTVAPTGHVTVPINHGEKFEKFNGLNFKRWQQKMLFYLTTLNLARFLTEDAPTNRVRETYKLSALLKLGNILISYAGIMS
ncbi:Uncharacterized protein Adt_10475 [Abeliophyllum distichum]|uniref:Gag-pol polyprotein n=1 Tax=Abeliophyllum distichum TaxID=126358 RepID=A0ABD1UK34_9LAMI